MTKYYETKTAPESAGAQPHAETMEEFAARERIPTMERARRLSAENERQQRAIAGDLAVDRMKHLA